MQHHRAAEVLGDFVPEGELGRAEGASGVGDWRDRDCPVIAGDDL